MTAVKICGITRVDDAIAAADLGVDALGFIFYQDSPRFVKALTVAKIVDVLVRRYPRGVRGFPKGDEERNTVAFRPALVGVFVDEDPEEVQRIASFCRLDMFQFHGDETPAYCRLFPRERVIKALTVRDEPSAFDVEAILLDSRLPGRYGGTGQTVDWERAASFKFRGSLILSGGLNGDNMETALGKVAPDAVDVCSGVENRPGWKDPQKMARLVATVRTFDRRHRRYNGIGGENDKTAR